jgi:chromate transporter
VSWLMLYLIFLKGTATTFAGFTSLPVIREDLVIRRHVATDEQLDRAVAVARSTPGPMGLHVVSIGYQVAGWKGACAGWLAMITPAFLVLPLLRWVGATRRDRRLRSALNAVVIASSALLLGTTISLARSLQGNWFLLAVSGASLVALTATRQSALRVMAVAGLASLLFAAWNSRIF